VQGRDDGSLTKGSPVPEKAHECGAGPGRTWRPGGVRKSRCPCWRRGGGLARAEAIRQKAQRRGDLPLGKLTRRGDRDAAARQPLGPENTPEDVVQRAGTRGSKPNGQSVQRGAAAQESDVERPTTTPTNGRARKRSSGDSRDGSPTNRHAQNPSAVRPAPLRLTFQGLENCDGCGTVLALRERLAGLCGACQGPMPQLRPVITRKRRSK